MPILIILVGAVAAAGLWYFRMRGPAAVGDAVNAAGHLKGAYSRRKFRNKVEASTLTAIEDPALAAAVFLVSVADAGPGFGPAEERAVTAWLRDVADYEDPVEAVIFARWVSREVVDVNEVGRKLTPLWRERLNGEQRQDLLQAAADIAAIRGPDIAQTEALRRLRERLSN